MNRRGDVPAATDEAVARETIDGHNRRASQQSAELNHVADYFAGHGNYSHGGRLVVHHADRHLVGDDAA